MFAVARNLCKNLTKIIPRQIPTPQTAAFHLLSKTNTICEATQPKVTFLSPLNVNLVPQCGFKVKGKPRRRCKDCYFVRRGERLFVICEKHPRHKQMQIVKAERNTWMLSHATQGKIRPW